MNEWVSKKTNNKINDLINKDGITDDTMMYLLNAIYFKGSWKISFNQNHTKKSPFYISKNQHIEVCI